MIVKCPECELPVSTKALTCPHCGYPITGSKPRNITKQHMRLPNGFGRITEIKSGNLRNRFRVMVTVGKDSDGRPIGQLLKPNAYFKTYNEAYAALVEYNKNPYQLEDQMNLEDLYKKWIDSYSKTLSSQSSLRTIKAAWKHCAPLYKTPVNLITTGHLKENIMNAEASDNIKNRMKSIYNLMFDYALEYGLIKYNPARAFNMGKTKPVTDHIPFTNEEIAILWSNLDKPYVNIILLQCYMGWRPQELGLIKLEDVDLSKRKENIIGGIKTEAGTNRKVPIHPLILPIVQALLEEALCLGSEYLINCTDAHTSLKMTYDKYEYRFKNIIKDLGLNESHRPHDPRKHFISMCKKYNVNEYAIKRMVGHEISDITEKVYTERDPEWLFTEIRKIPLES